jgi:DNA polymerase (family 10)
MPANNLKIADIFEQIAEILDIQGGNFFRIRAYRQGAQQLRGMYKDIAQYVAKGHSLALSGQAGMRHPLCFISTK